MKDYWFISRPKRSLVSVLPLLIAFSDICVGKIWSGNVALQLELEDLLRERNIVNSGTKRARRIDQGGGGARTYYTQLKDLGLLFEDSDGILRLTCVAEDILSGRTSFVDGMTMQLQRYQYPSNTRLTGSGGVTERFYIHPFQFLIRLLLSDRLDGYLSQSEVAEVVIHYAETEKDIDKVIDLILGIRSGKYALSDDPNKTFQNVANTFFNYLNLTQIIDRGSSEIRIRDGKLAEALSFVEPIKFIKFPEHHDIYQRAYGRGSRQRDLRNFKKQTETLKQKNERMILREFLQITIQQPVTEINLDIVKSISRKTGLDEKMVERYLTQNYSKRNIDSFFVNYRELAYMGIKGAKDFELATCQVFQNIFGMKVRHVGPLGNTPDVYVESDNWCGIIDNKSYKNGYSVSGDHRRKMEDVYIKNYQLYGQTDKPLVFFSYLAGSFGSNINRQIIQIVEDTGINGSAMPIDIFINLAQDYVHNNYSNEILKKIFSVNREVRLSDLPNVVKLRN